jgi:hypothetical protein
MYYFNTSFKKIHTLPRTLVCFCIVSSSVVISSFRICKREPSQRNKSFPNLLSYLISCWNAVTSAAGTYKSSAPWVLELALLLHCLLGLHRGLNHHETIRLPELSYRLLLLPERTTKTISYNYNIIWICSWFYQLVQCQLNAPLVFANIIFVISSLFSLLCVFLDGFPKYQLQSIISHFESFSADCLAWVSIPFKLEGLEFCFGFTCFFLGLPIHLIFESHQCIELVLTVHWH